MMNLDFIQPEYWRPIQEFLLQYPQGKVRDKVFIQILQEFQPPKVTKAEVDRWWKWKKLGIDADRGDVKFDKRIRRKKRKEFGIRNILSQRKKPQTEPIVEQKTLKEEYKNQLLQQFKSLSNSGQQNFHY